jgi:hypothetical protein
MRQHDRGRARHHVLVPLVVRPGGQVNDPVAVLVDGFGFYPTTETHHIRQVDMRALLSGSQSVDFQKTQAT